jgi:ribosomal protein S18 acetylase RimI-like enzyme
MSTIETFIRPLTSADEPILWKMQYYASLMDQTLEPMGSVKLHPYISRYFLTWGRRGDLGFVAEEKHSKMPVGAAWCRVFGERNKGYGFISDKVPELSIAVLPEYRHSGIGTALIKELLNYLQDKIPAISLAVRSTNPALHLYERMGFVRIPERDFQNRTGILSFVMVKKFA